MNTFRYSTILFAGLLICSCSTTLKAPIITRNEKIEGYKYVFISPTSDKTSSSGSVYKNYGSTTSNTINPSDVISGILTKEGFIRLPELKPELTDETIIVNYGESGTRNTGMGGYAMEVTIQFISAKSNKLIGSCTAKGQGRTEVDDIREAITRCLSGLLSKDK